MTSRRNGAWGPDALWVIPLAVASLVFYKLTRWTLQFLRELIFRFDPKERPQWYMLSQATISRKGALPVIMATSRWNTHAVVGSTGSLVATKAISFRSASLSASGGNWTVVLNRAPHYQTVDSHDSIDALPAEEWHEFSVSPGRYVLALRCYDPDSTIELPAVRVDGEDLISTVTVSSDINGFYNDLGTRKHPFYRALHFYVYALLRFAHLFPAGVVEREFLPMGNPRTNFYYGSIESGQTLRIEAPTDLEGGSRLYYTLYDLHCFPSAWYRIDDSPHVTAPAPRRGYYLIRHNLTREGGDLAPVSVSIVR